MLRFELKKVLGGTGGKIAALLLAVAVALALLKKTQKKV